MDLIADTQKIIEQFIQTRVNDAGAEGVVLGLSGGIDSAVTLALSVSALGSENVVGLIMPFNTSESITLASDHAKKLGVNQVTGIEIDPRGIVNSKNNCLLNNVTIDFHESDDLIIGKDFDIVIANIYSGIFEHE